MKHLILILASLLFTSLCQAKEQNKLNEYIQGLDNTHSMFKKIAAHKDFFIPSYLSQLKKVKGTAKIPANLKYELWRHYSDCHHICEVMHHQSYLLPDNLPIFNILEEAFPGFKKASRMEKGHIMISKGFDFLQTIDPYDELRKKP